MRSRPALPCGRPASERVRSGGAWRRGSGEILVEDLTVVTDADAQARVLQIGSVLDVDVGQLFDAADVLDIGAGAGEAQDQVSASWPDVTLAPLDSYSSSPSGMWL